MLGSTAHSAQYAQSSNIPTGLSSAIGEEATVKVMSGCMVVACTDGMLLLPRVVSGSGLTGVERAVRRPAFTSAAALLAAWNKMDKHAEST